MKNISDTEPKKSNIWLLFLFLVVVIIVWKLSINYINNNFSTSQDKGLFGDSFGAVNSLFSGLAFAGIIYTILLQRKELEYQREELIETRKVLKRSAHAQEKSQKALAKQIKSMNISAKLNGFSTLVEFYNSKGLNLGPGIEKENSKNKANDFIKYIENILLEIEEGAVKNEDS